MLISPSFFKDHDDCDPNPCLNGATCGDVVDDYICRCVAGWEGKNCEIGTELLVFYTHFGKSL